MFCQRCGAKNQERAFYCKECGVKLEDEIETVVAVRQPEDLEKQIFSVRPTLFFVKLGYALAVLAAFLLVFVIHLVSGLLGFDIPSWLYVLTGLLLLLIPGYFHFRRNMIKYTLTDSKIEIDEGFLFQHSRNIPLRSIQDVSVYASVLQRILGYGNVLIDNASEEAGKVILRNVEQPKKLADLILKQLRKIDQDR